MDRDSPAPKLSPQGKADNARARRIERHAPPLPEVAPPFPAEPPLSAGLADLVGLWLNVRCCCGQSVSLPLRLMAALHGWRTPLGEIVPKLRCKGCGQRPAVVDLTDDPTIDAVGMPKSGRASRLRLIG